MAAVLVLAGAAAHLAPRIWLGDPRFRPGVYPARLAGFFAATEGDGVQLVLPLIWVRPSPLAGDPPAAEVRLLGGDAGVPVMAGRARWPPPGDRRARVWRGEASLAPVAPPGTWTVTAVAVGGRRHPVDGFAVRVIPRGAGGGPVAVARAEAVDGGLSLTFRNGGALPATLGEVVYGTAGDRLLRVTVGRALRALGELGVDLPYPRPPAAGLWVVRPYFTYAVADVTRAAAAGAWAWVWLGGDASAGFAVPGR